jgi:hypothetical protein
MNIYENNGVALYDNTSRHPQERLQLVCVMVSLLSKLVLKRSLASLLIVSIGYIETYKL